MSTAEIFIDDVADAGAALRFARALGTLLTDDARAQHSEPARVRVGRAADGALLPVRDALVQGLVISGVAVVDAGRATRSTFAASRDTATADAALFLVANSQQRPSGLACFGFDPARVRSLLASHSGFAVAVGSLVVEAHT